MTPEQLLEYARMPGYATKERTQDVMDFLVKFQEMLDIYRSAYGEPIGRSVESTIDRVDWYLTNHTFEQDNT